MAVAFRTSAQAAKTLMVLGLLQRGPLHGYELHRIVVAHGALYADFKKPTLYHLLDRLAEAGAVAVTKERGTRGRRGERLIYALTPAGRKLFAELLRDTLGTYEPLHTGLDVAIVFMARLPENEARDLMQQRKSSVLARRSVLAAEPGATGRLAIDHALRLIDAELAWIEDAVTRVGQPPPMAKHNSPAS